MTQQRTLVISDVHGCHEELQDLMDKCQYSSSDRVISLGDVTDRGLYPRECVEFFMKRDVVGSAETSPVRSMVIGNHEATHLRYYEEWCRTGAVEKFRSDYHKATFEALKPEHLEWFKTLPAYLELPEYTGPDGNLVVLIHAGCIPDVPLREQDPKLLTHIANIRSPLQGIDLVHGTQHGYWNATVRSWWTSKAPADTRFWASLYDGSLGFVIFGHTGFLEPARFPHAWGLDLGCAFGRKLCAVILPDWKIVTTQARRAYKKTEKIKLFEVYPGIKLFS